MQAEPSQSWARDGAAFASALLDADAPPPDFLTSSAGNNDPRRYAVYRNNVTVGLVRAMHANFPSIVRLLGDEFFSAMAQIYVTAHPPISRLMSEYGAEFSGFLRSFGPVQPYPYLPDVARIEQAWREAFHEEDAPVLHAGDLANIAPDDLPSLRLVTHPASRLIQSQWAAGSIFSANRSGEAVDKIEVAKGEWVLVTRQKLDCEVRILDAAQGLFIEKLIRGQTLSAAVDAATATGEPFDLAGTVSGLIASSAFTSIQGSDL
jgi:hypothetical protein